MIRNNENHVSAADFFPFLLKWIANLKWSRPLQGHSLWWVLCNLENRFMCFHTDYHRAQIKNNDLLIFFILNLLENVSYLAYAIFGRPWIFWYYFSVDFSCFHFNPPIYTFSIYLIHQLFTQNTPSPPTHNAVRL